MDSRGQNVVEFTVLVAASTMVLILIFSVYSSQRASIENFDDYHVARNTVKKIVDAANTVYYSGPGSEKKVLIDIPDSVLMEESGIQGNLIYLKMSGGADIIGVADANIGGSWPEKGVHYMALRNLGEGDNNIDFSEWRAFEVSGSTMFLLNEAGEGIDRNFSIISNSSGPLDFSLNINFSGGSSDTNIAFENGSEEMSFSLAPGKTKLVPLEIEIAEGAGNAAGKIITEATSGEYAWVEDIFLSVEHAQ